LILGVLGQFDILGLLEIEIIMVGGYQFYVFLLNCISWNLFKGCLDDQLPF